MFYKMRNKNRKSETILAERSRRDPLTSWSKILRKRFSDEEIVIFRHELSPLDALELPLLSSKEFGKENCEFEISSYLKNYRESCIWSRQKAQAVFYDIRECDRRPPRKESKHDGRYIVKG